MDLLKDVRWKSVLKVVSLVFIGFLIGVLGTLNIVIYKLSEYGMTLDLFYR